jgi:hypothetical protein
VYEGQWEIGKKHGQGTYTGADGTIYEGHYNDGRRHGKGTCTWASGRVYKGQWENGKTIGRGTHLWRGRFPCRRVGVGAVRRRLHWAVGTG